MNDDEEVCTGGAECRCWSDGAWLGARVGAPLGGLGAFLFFLCLVAWAHLTGEGGSCQ